MTSTLHVRAGRGGPRRLRSCLIAVLASLALLGQARAQSLAPVTPPPEAGMVQDQKEPVIALGLSLLGPGAAVALAWREMRAGAQSVRPALILALTPGIGHWYAGETRSALIHTGVRAGAFAALFAGLYFMSGDEHGRDSPREAGGFLAVGGFTVLAASAIYTVVDAPFAAWRHNARARRQPLLLAPALVVSPDHAPGVGLQLGGRF